MRLCTGWVCLMLVTALPDVCTTCPLILQHPDLVRLGEEIRVNCSASDDGHRGLYFSYANVTTHEEFDSYIELWIPSVHLDTKATCRIKVNDTYECSEDLRLTVYKVVQINETAEENALHKFQCDLHDHVPWQNQSVTWYMGSQVINTGFYKDSASAGWSGRSSLERNVSRNDNGAAVTCEVRMDPGAQGHAFVSNKTWILSVPDSQILDTNDNIDFALNNSTNATSGNETHDTTTAPPPKIPDNPLTITPSRIVVQYNDSASAVCSTTEDHDGLGWEATGGGTGVTKNVKNLEWRVQKVDWTTTAECFMNLKNGTQYKVSLDIIVYYLPDRVQVSPFEGGELVEGKPHLMECDFSHATPRNKLRVKWFREDKLIRTVNGSAFLTVIPEKEDDKANFTCEVELLLERERANPKVVSEPYTANVQYKPSMQDCPGKYAGKEDEFQLDAVPCEANGNPPPVIYWYYKNQLVNSTEPLRRSNSGTYTATAKNIVGNISTTVAITVEYGPLFTCEGHYNVTENAHFVSACEPEGIPKPKSVWFKDEKQVEFPNVWKRHDGGTYLQVATNEHGQANVTLSINVFYAPSFSEDITQEFHMGENLTLNCSADGNPLPQLHWKYPSAANVNATTRGRQILITQATPTNAGVYVCNATNDIGSVSRTVTLIMKGTTHIDYYMISIFALVAFLFAIFIVVLFYRNHKNKSGNYNVIGLSDIVPLTSRSNVI